MITSDDHPRLAHLTRAPGVLGAGGGGVGVITSDDHPALLTSPALPAEVLT